MESANQRFLPHKIPHFVYPLLLLFVTSGCDQTEDDIQPWTVAPELTSSESLTSPPSVEESDLTALINDNKTTTISPAKTVEEPQIEKATTDPFSLLTDEVKNETNNNGKGKMRAVMEVDRMGLSVCANGGQFLKAFCVADYNCGRGSAQKQQNWQRVCIRGRCCVRTEIVADRASNARREEDKVHCPNGGFYMDRRCSRPDQCNAEDPLYGQRPFPLQICVRNNCCSSVYRKPERVGTRCLNGGKYMGRDCVMDADCGNGQWVCVEGDCCSDDDRVTSIDGGGKEGIPSSEDIIVVEGNNDINSEDGKEKQLRFDDEAKKKLLRERGRSACRYYGLFTGQRCRKPSECGYTLTRTMACISGYCCAHFTPSRTDDDDNSSTVPERDNDGQFLEAKRRCNTRLGIFIGTPCQTRSDCLHPRIAVNRQNRCLEKHCCSLPIINDMNSEEKSSEKGESPDAPRRDSPRGGIENVCSDRSSRFTHFIGRTCTHQKQCQRVYDFTGKEMLVECIDGFCCSLSPNAVREDFQGDDDDAEMQREDFEQKGGARLGRNYGYCYDGKESRIECKSADDCLYSSEICINGLCCKNNLNAREKVCGGLAANTECFANSRCDNNLFCTPANFCCECRYGQPQSSGPKNCLIKPCNPGYKCSPEGFCCPECPNGDTPLGSCYEGKCKSKEYRCRPGNICCKIS